MSYLLLVWFMNEQYLLYTACDVMLGGLIQIVQDILISETGQIFSIISHI